MITVLVFHYIVKTAIFSFFEQKNPKKCHSSKTIKKLGQVVKNVSGSKKCTLIVVIQSTSFLL